MLRLRDILYSHYSDMTGQSVEQIAQDCERNKWLNAQEMVEYGLVDKILEKPPTPMGTTPKD